MEQTSDLFKTERSLGLDFMRLILVIIGFQKLRNVLYICRRNRGLDGRTWKISETPYQTEDSRMLIWVYTGCNFPKSSAAHELNYDLEWFYVFWCKVNVFKHDCLVCLKPVSE